MSGSAPARERRFQRVERPAWVVPTRWVVALALSLAALRLVGLSRWSLWIDEAFTLHDAFTLSLERLTNFPLGLALIRAWAELVGTPLDEVWLRLPAAVLGALTVPLTAWAFAPLLGARRAWFAAAALSLSSWHWFWSQSARAYTLMLALSLLGAGVSLRGLVFARPLVYWLGLAVAASSALAHPTGALAALALLAAPSLSRSDVEPLPYRPRAWIGVLLLLAVGAASSSWLLAVWRDYSWRKSGSSLAHFALTTGFYVGVPLALACLCAAWDALRGGSARMRLLLAGLVVAVSAPVVASLVVRVSAQYVFVLAPWIAALAALALDDERSPRWRARALGLLILAWGAFDLGAYLSVRHGDRPRWREAYAYVARARGAEDLVFGMAAPVGGFYLAPGERALRNSPALLPLTHFSWEDLRYWSAAERGMWFVLNREDLRDWPADERARFERYLREQCELRRTFGVRLTPRRLDVEVHRRL